MKRHKILGAREAIRHGGWIALWLCMMVSGCRWGERPNITTQKREVPEPVVRVKLLGPALYIPLSIDGPFTVYSFHGKAVLQCPSLAYSEVKVIGDTLVLGSRRVTIDDFCDLVPERNGSVALEYRYYRGSLRLHRTADGQLVAVNHVRIEDYLKGVLRGELPNNFSAEAYKALAVAARTYALFERYSAAGQKKWDLAADEKSQMYLGRAAETGKAVEAAQATRGVVLTANMGSRGWKIFPAYFSSTCGGKTQAGRCVAANLDPRITPLRGGVNCIGCSISPRYRWPDVVISDAEVTQALNKSALVPRPFQRVTAINILGWENNRITKVEVVDRTGQRLILSGVQFRLIIGPARVPSTWCKIRSENEQFVFYDGHGFGHGVGLCQYGAEGMARKGYTAYEILLHYYPGAKLVKAF
jgi:stage II sporulation protein D